MGRHKINQVAHTELEEMIAQEINNVQLEIEFCEKLPSEWLRLYSNSIAHRHPTQDSEQDGDICIKEHEIWSECALKKLEL